MACFEGFICMWPSEVLGMDTWLFFDDFETGDFSMGWTAADVDGLVPHSIHFAFETQPRQERPLAAFWPAENRQSRV